MPIYSSIRIIFFTVVFIVVSQIIKKSKLMNKRREIKKTIVICFALTMLSTGFPLENYIVTFTAADKAFRYKDIGEVKAVIEGVDSAMVIYTNKNKTGPQILPKIKDGYGVSKPWPIAKKTIIFFKLRTGHDLDIMLYEVKNSNDVYLMAWKPFGTEPLDIRDSLNSEFLCVENPFVPGLHYKYYMYISAENFDLKNYTIYIDGEEYTYAAFDLRLN